MNWLADFVRPKINALIRRSEVPDNLWTKCPNCEHMLFTKDLKARQMVCHHCDHHLRLSVQERLELLFDDGIFTKLDLPAAQADPLKFKDTKRYSDRLKEYRSKTQSDDAITVAYGTVNKEMAVVAAFNFAFMGGSMGMYVGEGIVKACEFAIKSKCGLIVVPASGGARMQEGILSLMQMPRTTVGVERLKEAGLPYITLLTDPTTGGVSASFAMLGDIAVAEPGAIIGFAGARVIEQTIKQQLPEGFQKAEYLLEHGMVDLVIHRRELKSTLSKLLKFLADAS